MTALLNLRKFLQKRLLQFFLRDKKYLMAKKTTVKDIVEWTGQRIEYFSFNTSFFAGVYSNMQRKSAEKKIELSLHEFRMDSLEESYLQLQKLRGTTGVC